MKNLLYREIKLGGRSIYLMTIIWFALALTAALIQVSRWELNNFLIFKGVFWHTVHQLPLYPEYPQEYADSNHYGPVFSLIIAPFALLPTWLGTILWCMANAAMLFYAIRRLKLPVQLQLIILGITAIEMMTSTHNVQFNPMLTAWLLLAYTLVEEEKDFWATLFIALGFLVKLYGIAGLLFFMFSRHKFTFIWSFVFWLAVGFCLPMLISSPQYIANTYVEWYEKLKFKNNKNTSVILSGGMQDISVMGMLRRTSGNGAIGNLVVLAPAAALILLPLLRVKQYFFEGYRLTYLVVVLISVVIFSSSAESATYVVAVAGAAIWYAINYQKGRKLANIMLVLLFLLTILSATDLFPPYVRTEIIRKYSLKALPCFLIWLLAIKDLLLRNFALCPSADQ